MRIEHANFNEDPEKITSLAYDCIWVQLESRKSPSPLKSKALQWLDWKMHGQLSRLIFEAPKESTTFIPTMKRLSVPYLAIDRSGATDWAAFFKNCEGLKLRSVLFFCEEPDKLEAAERELSRRSGEGFPETVAVGSDEAGANG